MDYFRILSGTTGQDMPALHNAQHEDYAQRLAKGEAMGPAYAAAGFTPNNANARRLANKPRIKARVAELLARGCELADLSTAKTLVELDRIASANIADYFEVVRTKSGYEHQLKDLTKLPRHLTAAISSLSFDKDGNPRLKLHDKVAALDKLGRNQGLFAAEASLSVQVTLADLVSASYAVKHPEALLPKVIEGEVVR